jgi:hypothetical protein
MSQPQPTRAEIYERIKASSKQEVILEEMQRLGFWPKGEAQPQLAAAHIQREGELQRELAELRKQIAVRQDPERALRQMRKQRMQKALEQREETKRRQAQERHDKALAWHAKRATHAGYLGPGVSAALQEGAQAPGERRQADPQRLARHGLPELADAAQLAQAMGISVAELRFLGFHREVARTHHYHSFTLPKKTGGERLISAPCRASSARSTGCWTTSSPRCPRTMPPTASWPGAPSSAMPHRMQAATWSSTST